MCKGKEISNMFFFGWVKRVKAGELVSWGRNFIAKRGVGALKKLSFCQLGHWQHQQSGCLSDTPLYAKNSIFIMATKDEDSISFENGIHGRQIWIFSTYFWLMHEQAASAVFSHSFFKETFRFLVYMTTEAKLCPMDFVASVSPTHGSMCCEQNEKWNVFANQEQIKF